MGKISKRNRLSSLSLSSRSSRSSRSQSIENDDDSGFCGSNIMPPSVSSPPKVLKLDDEMMLLKALMKEVNDPMDLYDASPHTLINSNIINNESMTLTKMSPSLSSKSRNGKYELKILSQPEEQHRARYLTEGSRGAIKDRSGMGHPVIKLFGYNESIVKVECFIGHDKHIGSPHLFYQASKIMGKNSTRCGTTKIDGTVVVVMDATPENDMKVCVDCIGILKERNVDVEQKLERLRNRCDDNGDDIDTSANLKKRSTRCRLVFRCKIPNSNEVLQVVSAPIICTQPLGTPEICKKSLTKCDISGGEELFIIGKNFLKDSKVVFKNGKWTKIVEPDKEFLHSSHILCTIPPYEGPDLDFRNSFEVTLSVKSGGKYSDAHSLTYIKKGNVNTMTLLNGTTQQLQLGATNGQILFSNFDKPIVFTMIGSAPSMINTPKPADPMTLLENKEKSHMISISNLINSANHETVLPIVDEDTSMHSLMSNSLSSNSHSFTPETSGLSFTPETPGLSFENLTQNLKNNRHETAFQSQQIKSNVSQHIHNDHTCINNTMTTLNKETFPQYLNDLNTAYDAISQSNDALIINNTADTHTNISSNAFDSNTITNMMIHETNTPQNTELIRSSPICVEPTNIGPLLLDRVSSLIQSPNTIPVSLSETSVSVNSVFNPIPTASMMTQASNISAMSELSDTELLRFINPATFDQM